MAAVFISHSTKDDEFVRELRWTLADLKQEVWIDSRELRAGDPLWPEIQKAIEDSSAFAVVVSPDALQAKWVGKELRHALEMQKQRGRDKFPVFALSLDGTKLGVLESLFGEEPLYIPVSSAAGGVEAAMNPILVAMGKRLPAEVPLPPQPKAEPLEELVLELTDLKFREEAGVRRASAKARLVYEPATPGQREVASAQSWRLIAPIGPIEAGELSWYLEHYAIWPSHYFGERARKVEENLVKWGRLLHDAALPAAHRENVMNAWATIDDQAGRRFSVHVDATLEAGAPEAEAEAAKEAATELLKLPWELLHDGDSYLFQGATPLRVRRRLPNTHNLNVNLVAAPIRVLLVTARPEDDSCGYIDHRASALPLFEAMEKLGGLVRLHVLSPPTFDAMGRELKRAFDAREPYHVVHFDGHGVYDKTVGLGGLCFEHPQDTDKLDQRRHVTVHTDKLGPLLKDHRIPLVFLEACQTAQAEDTSESVASELLQRGVASVVAMSHSVLVETARRFVETFYASLAHGRRVGDAMLEGQRGLKDDTFRGRIFGAGDLHLEDWFVPVLFQEKDDPQLFRNTPAPQTQADLRTLLWSRLGGLPEELKTGFIGRSRELLALERLLRPEGKTRYAVVRGQGGEGKTALAAEFARWMVRSHQVRRAAFVSVETDGNYLAMLGAIGSQLVGKDYSPAAFDDVEKAILPIERALREQATLLVVDNMESVLLPPYMQDETPEALSEEAGHELKAFLALCERLLKVGETRIVFTSREALPAPFNASRHRRELHRLDREDAVKLVERALNADDGTGAGPTLDAARESIEALVDAVHGHARTLALLAPELRCRGVEATCAALVELMAEMERQFPASRDHSFFASVELSLRRLSAANRDRVRVLGMFHGRLNFGTLMDMMQWKKSDVDHLSEELFRTGLATHVFNNHFALNPALCPYTRSQIESSECEALTARWAEATGRYLEFLNGSSDQSAAVTLTLLELPNFFALLDFVQCAGNQKATISVAISLFNLLKHAGKPRLLERVGKIRDAALANVGHVWNSLSFNALAAQVEQQLISGDVAGARNTVGELLRRCESPRAAGYPGADYDFALGLWLQAQVTKAGGESERALWLIHHVREQFERLPPSRDSKSMIAKSLSTQAGCLLDLGRLDEAANNYEEAIRLSEELGDERSVASDKVQIGTVRKNQRRYQEALQAYSEARERFARLNEPGSVATTWHQAAMVYRRVGQQHAAEDALRKSLAISVRIEDDRRQAAALLELGILYAQILRRYEEATSFFRQAAEKYAKCFALAEEGAARNNLANSMLLLHRHAEARDEILRAIECKASSDNSAEPWVSWDVLTRIERADGNQIAAAEARRKAIRSYLGFRRDGGENHSETGRLIREVTAKLRAGEVEGAKLVIGAQAERFRIPGFGTFIRALQTIVAGNRDRSLADAPDLDYTIAAEILLLLETLEKSGK